MLAHPVARILLDERVGRLAMREDVHEEASARLQPLRHVGKGPRPIAQVLEHLDRHDPVEALRGVEDVEIAGDHADISKAALDQLRLDVVALRMRVRYRGDRLRGGARPSTGSGESYTSSSTCWPSAKTGTLATGVEGVQPTFGLCQRVRLGPVTALLCRLAGENSRQKQREENK